MESVKSLLNILNDFNDRPVLKEEDLVKYLTTLYSKCTPSTYNFISNETNTDIDVVQRRIETIPIVLRNYNMLNQFLNDGQKLLSDIKQLFTTINARSCKEHNLFVVSDNIDDYSFEIKSSISKHGIFIVPRKHSPFYTLNCITGTRITHNMELYFETPNNMFSLYFCNIGNIFSLCDTFVRRYLHDEDTPELQYDDLSSLLHFNIMIKNEKDQIITEQLPYDLNIIFEHILNLIISK